MHIPPFTSRLMLLWTPAISVPPGHGVVHAAQASEIGVLGHSGFIYELANGLVGGTASLESPVSVKTLQNSFRVKKPEISEKNKDLVPCLANDELAND